MSLKICDGNETHAEITYESMYGGSDDCPLCEALELTRESEDLLAACHLLLELAERTVDGQDPLLILARAAIDRAEGRKP